MLRPLGGVSLPITARDADGYYGADGRARDLPAVLRPAANGFREDFDNNAG